MIVLAYALAITLLVIAIIHLYWALGGTAGLEASIPTTENGEKLFVPTAMQCVALGFTLIIFSVFIVNKVSYLPFTIPHIIEKYALYIIGIIFLLRSIGDTKYVGVIKKVSDTKFGELDTKFYSPLCLLIGAGVIFLEWTI